MNDIIDRLAEVPADDLAQVDAESVRRRLRTRQRHQRGVAAFGLLLVAGGAVLAASTLGGGSPQVAESPPPSTPADIRPGTWTLVHPAMVNSTTTSLELQVTPAVEGAGCGSQFEFLDPVVTFEAGQIIIRTDGAYTPPEPDVIHTCEGVAAIIPVELEEPIGARALFDAYDDGIRWQPVWDGDDASWDLVDPASVSSATTVLEIGVTRTSCSSGYTGEVIGVQVTLTEDEVLIRAAVEPDDLGSATCQGNPAVPHTVVLSEPVGDRILVDELCRQAPDSGYSYCLDDGIRWRP